MGFVPGGVRFPGGALGVQQGFQAFLQQAAPCRAFLKGRFAPFFFCGQVLKGSGKFVSQHGIFFPKEGCGAVNGSGEVFATPGEEGLSPLAFFGGAGHQRVQGVLIGVVHGFEALHGLASRSCGLGGKSFHRQAKPLEFVIVGALDGGKDFLGHLSALLFQGTGGVGVGSVQRWGALRSDEGKWCVCRRGVSGGLLQGRHANRSWTVFQWSVRRSLLDVFFRSCRRAFVRSVGKKGRAEGVEELFFLLLNVLQGESLLFQNLIALEDCPETAGTHPKLLGALFRGDPVFPERVQSEGEHAGHLFPGGFVQ